MQYRAGIVTAQPLRVEFHAGRVQIATDVLMPFPVAIAMVDALNYRDVAASKGLLIHAAE